MRRIPLMVVPLLLALLPGCDDATYPFEEVTSAFTFQYELSQSGSVDVLVLNCYVSEVRNLLADSAQTAGMHSLSWDLQDESGNRVPDGLYYIRILLNDDIVETLMYEVHQ